MEIINKLTCALNKLDRNDMVADAIFLSKEDFDVLKNVEGWSENNFIVDGSIFDIPVYVVDGLKDVYVGIK